MSTTGVVAWLATYALHSTVLLGAAALLSGLLRSDTWRETFWKTALVGGLATATLPTALGIMPLVGTWAMIGAGDGAGPIEGPATAPEPAGGPAEAAPGIRPADDAIGRATPASDAEIAVAPRTAATPAPVGLPWTSLVVGVWIAVALLLLVRLAVQHVRLFAALRGRRPITEGPLAGMVAELRRRAGFWAPVRLTVSAACPTPIAIGRSEVCVPERFVGGLDTEQQRAALAHELAHLRRRDPLWQLAAGVMESVFFFQPLHRVARLRLREAAEHLCDDWAVRQTGSPLGLARCLADVASWIGGMPVPERTMAMAEGGSPLLRRIERLADWREASGGTPAVRPLVAAALLGVVAVVAPAVSGAAPATWAATAPPSAGAAPAAATRDTVIRHPDPSRPLEARWAWALERPSPGEFWVAWEIETAVPAEERIASNSPGRAGAAGAPLSRTLDEPATGGRAALVFGFDADPAGDAVLRRIRLRGLGADVDLEGRPLLWLGGADGRESLALLRRLHGTLEPALRQEIAAAYTLHASAPDVLEAVETLLRDEADPAVRAEAVQWLPRIHRGEARFVELVARVATRDPALRVQAEATDALVTLMAAGASGSRAALVRLAETHPDWTIRSEAAQSLAARRD